MNVMNCSEALVFSSLDLNNFLNCARLYFLHAKHLHDLSIFLLSFAYLFWFNLSLNLFLNVPPDFGETKRW